MLFESAAVGTPLLSICIPQHNRTSFLLVLLRAIRRQRFRQVEVCVSDGGSTDGRHPEIISFLEDSGLAFRYRRSEQNLRYDLNLRLSLDLARGRYCMLFGNDDTLADSNALTFLSESLACWDFPEVALTNYLELSTGRTMRRVSRTGILGAGPETALANFRNFSFVSGIVLERERAQRVRTERWDGSEMYQMYLGCRIVALGGRLLGIEQVLVHKDVQIRGEVADSYARKPRVPCCGILPRRLPLSQYAAVALDAITGSTNRVDRELYARQLLQQVLLFTYPPWLVEYRQVQSWRFALEVALGMNPEILLQGGKVSSFVRAYLWSLYLAVNVAGLLVPGRLFAALRPWLYRWAKH